MSSVAQVESQLVELWRDAAGGEEPVTRACKLNLVVVCAEGGADAATRLVARLSETEPARALVVVPTSDPAAGLSAYVSAHCHRGARGQQICSEQITLTAPEHELERVPTTVLQLLVGDLAVHVLWRRPELEPRALLEGLCRDADRLIVDGSALDSPLVELAKIAFGRGVRVDDLTWARLEPWREAVALLFDTPGPRAALGRMRRVRIAAGRRTSAAYLAGWLASRLGWRLSGGRWTHPGGDAVEVQLEVTSEVDRSEVLVIRLDAELEGVPVGFIVERVTPQENVVRLRLERSGTCPVPRRIKLPERDEVALLCGMLQRQQDDPVYKAALGEAAAMV